MQVTPNILKKALLRIFQNEGLQAEESIALSDLHQLWAQTGLRHDDLRDALRLVFEAGYATFVNRGGSMAIQLEAPGFELTRDQPINWSGLLQFAQEKYTLYRAGLRAPRKLDAGLPKPERRGPAI